MSNLPSLIKKLQQLTRQHVAIENEIAQAQRQIVDAASAPRKRRPRTPDGRCLRDGVKATIKVLRDADGPLERQEVAKRLGIEGSAAGFRLAEAVRLKFVEKVGHGLYACVADVPAF